MYNHLLTYIQYLWNIGLVYLAHEMLNWCHLGNPRIIVLNHDFCVYDPGVHKLFFTFCLSRSVCQVSAHHCEVVGQVDFNSVSFPVIVIFHIRCSFALWVWSGCGWLFGTKFLFHFHHTVLGPSCGELNKQRPGDGGPVFGLLGLPHAMRNRYLVKHQWGLQLHPPVAQTKHLFVCCTGWFLRQAENADGVSPTMLFVIIDTDLRGSNVPEIFNNLVLCLRFTLEDVNRLF